MSVDIIELPKAKPYTGTRQTRQIAAVRKRMAEAQVISRGNFSWEKDERLPTWRHRYAWKVIGGVTIDVIEICFVPGSNATAAEHSDSVHRILTSMREAGWEITSVKRDEFGREVVYYTVHGPGAKEYVEKVKEQRLRSQEETTRRNERYESESAEIKAILAGVGITEYRHLSSHHDGEARVRLSLDDLRKLMGAKV